jgi:hypothetical protein
MNRPDAGHALLTDEQAAALAASFDAADGVFAVELPSIETLRAMSWRHAIHPTDAARAASHGYDPLNEITQDCNDHADDDALRCPACNEPLAADDWWEVRGTQWNGIDVEMASFACSKCGGEGEL